MCPALCARPAGGVFLNAREEMEFCQLDESGLKGLLATIESQHVFGDRLIRNLRASGWVSSVEGDATPGRLPNASIEEAVRYLLELVRQSLASTHALATTLGDDPRNVGLVWSHGFGAEGEDAAWVAERWEFFEKVLAKEEAVAGSLGLPSADRSPDGEPAEKPGLVLVVPIPAGSAPVGCLAVGRVPPKEFSSAEERTLKSAAFVLGETFVEVSGEDGSRRVLYSMIQSLAAALDARDPYTRGHSDRVAMYAMAIANEMDDQPESDLPGGLRDQLRLAALLHDIGKIGISDGILLKPAALTDEEYAMIKKHPVLGAEIVKSSGTLDHIIPGILYHHERCDGSGYPLGLTEAEIPLVARIIGLADAFDAMTSDRTFRLGMSQAEAIGFMKKYAGTHFTPTLVDALIRAYEKEILANVRVGPAGVRTSVEEEASLIEKAYPGLGDRIPSLPAVVGRLNEMVCDPDCAVSEIARVLSTDEGLVARVLRVANSAFYALPGRVSTIPLAITILGITTLRNLVIGTALADLTRSLTGSLEEAERLWDHSVDVGVWSRWIARKVGGLDPEEAFTAGLLHDIGKGLVLRALPADRQRVKGHLIESEESSTIEKETLGFDHTQMGGWAASRWSLPAALVEAVRWHHEPAGAEGNKPEIERLVWVIHVSDILARGGEAPASELVKLLGRKADPLVLRTLPVRDETLIEDILPFVVSGRGLARQLFSEAPAHAGAA